MHTRRNHTGKKRLGRKQTKKHDLLKLMFGGVSPKPLLRQPILKKAIDNKENLLELGSKTHIELGFDIKYCLYDIVKLNKLFRTFKIGSKIYLIIKDRVNKDIIKPLFQLVKNENGYYVIREIGQSDDTAGTYDLSKYTENILDIDIGKPTTYEDSDLKKKIDENLAAASGASASRTKSSRTSSNEVEELERELGNSNPYSVDKGVMVASVKDAHALAKKTMSGTPTQFEKLKATESKLKQTLDIGTDIFNLNAEIIELETKKKQFESLLQRRRSEFDADRISQINAKITELKNTIKIKKAEREEKLNVQQKISFTGGATRKKNHKKMKHHRSKITVKSK